MRAQHDLSLSSYEVLWFLADAEGGRLRMADIATHALLSRSGLTRMVDRLVELGYVARVRADDDGRGSMAELTAAGRVALDAARRTHLDGVRTHFLDRLSADEQRRMGDAWDRVLE
jgi:DNA-binding MarR family transcriptional regulator